MVLPFYQFSYAHTNLRKKKRVFTLEREMDGRIYELQADADGKRHAITTAESI